jgi:WD40 repeat protein
MYLATLTSATTDADNVIKVLCAETYLLLYTLRGHEADIDSLAFSKDCDKLASGESWGGCVVWSMSTGLEITRLKLRRSLTDLCFNETGDRLILRSCQRIDIWSIATGETVLTIKTTVTDCPKVNFSQSYSRLVTSCAPTDIDAECLIKTWDTTAGKEICSLRTLCEILWFACSGASDLVAVGLNDCTIEVYDLTTNRRIAIMKGQAHSADFFPDGVFLATACIGCVIRTWNCQQGSLAGTCTFNGPVATIKCFPNNPSQIAVGIERTAGKGAIIIFDRESDTEITELRDVCPYTFCCSGQSVILM